MSPSPSRLWQAQVLAAQLTQAGTTLQYDSTSATLCSAIATYADADADAAGCLANYWGLDHAPFLCRVRTATLLASPAACSCSTITWARPG